MILAILGVSINIDIFGSVGVVAVHRGWMQGVRGRVVVILILIVQLIQIDWCRRGHNLYQIVLFVFCVVLKWIRRCAAIVERDLVRGRGVFCLVDFHQLIITGRLFERADHSSGRSRGSRILGRLVAANEKIVEFHGRSRSGTSPGSTAVAVLTTVAGSVEADRTGPRSRSDRMSGGRRRHDIVQWLVP
jgi:hypothetical protein